MLSVVWVEHHLAIEISMEGVTDRSKDAGLTVFISSDDRMFLARA
jgi:hypothetical protein